MSEPRVSSVLGGCALIALLMAGISACAPRHSGQRGLSARDQKEISRLLKSPANIAYPQVEKFVFKRHCTECHNARERRDDVDLSSYTSVMAGDRLRKVVFPFDPERSPVFNTLKVPPGKKRHMPPREKQQLSPSQIELVYQWIKQGAGQHPGEVVSGPVNLKEELQPYFEQPESIDYKVVREKIFAQSCLKCHSSESEEADPDVLLYSANLTSYKTLFSRFNPVIKKGIPKESAIFEAVAIEQLMPPGSEGYDLLDSLLVKLLRLWILNCAIEDLAAIENDRLEHNPETPEKVRLCEGQ